MGVRIQLLGVVGSGKSYISNIYAKELRGYVLSFAEEVYRLASLVKGAAINKSIPYDRELLKLVGTTWGRESKQVDSTIQSVLETNKPKEWGTPDIWANIFIRNCSKLPIGSSIINDDTRFLNEIEIAIKKGAFIPVFVSCTEETRLSRLKDRGDEKDSNDPSHISEKLVNHLAKIVTKRYLMPVIWNDDVNKQPDERWVFSVDSFGRLLRECSNNEELNNMLRWQESILFQFLSNPF